MTRRPFIYGCTPADLQNMGMTGFLLRHAATNFHRSADGSPALECGGSTPLSHGVPPSGGLEKQPADSLTLMTGPEPRTAHPEPLTLTRSPIENPKSKIANRRRPRSKACRLPLEVQHTVNTMLAGGCRYRDIIHMLSDRGYSGFNKVNLNAWKRTGFQNWLRTRPAQPSSQSDVVTDANR